MELVYEVEITRLMPLDVQFRVPILSDYLYESNFEQQSLEVYDSGFHTPIHTPPKFIVLVFFPSPKAI